MYVTDALKTMTENTANFAGGSTLSKRYVDLIDRSAPASEGEALDANGIVDGIRERLMKLGK